MKTPIDYAKFQRLQMAFSERTATLRGLSDEHRHLIGHTGLAVTPNVLLVDGRETPGYVAPPWEVQRVHALKKRIAELEVETAPLGELVASLERYVKAATA